MEQERRQSNLVACFPRDPPVDVALEPALPRALRKAGERQTESVPTTTRAMVAYLHGTKIATDLTHPAHLREAETVLDDVDLNEYGLDAIVLVTRTRPTGMRYILAITDDERLTRDQLDDLFRQSRD